MSTNFDRLVTRTDTSCVKWDARESVFGDKDVLPMWVADMDFMSPNPVVQAMRRRAEHGVYGYTIAPPTYYEAIIQWLARRHGWRVEAEWLKFSPGVVPALSLMVEAFTQPGDKVLVQPPVYHPFFEVIRGHGREVLNNPLQFSGGRYTMDFDHLEHVVDDRVKMMILCSPHNPVGRVWTPIELVRLGEFCAKKGILVVSDEIHADIVYDPNVHTPLASISEAFADNTITCIAPSKTFNLAGLKTSTVIISNATLRNRYMQVLNQHCLDQHNFFGVVASETAYNEGEPWLEELLQYLRGNVEFLTKVVQENLGRVRVIQPEGTYLVWLDFRDLGLEPEKLKQLMLTEAKVALDQGYIFGHGGEGFARINIACPRTILEEGLKRIALAVRQIS